MSRSFEFDVPDVVTVGAIGPRGQRVFYLQVVHERELRTFKCEKQQVAALADYLARMLEVLPEADVVPVDAPEVVDPISVEWAVASLGVAYSADDDRLVVVAEELVEDVDDDDEQPDACVVRLSLTRGQVRGLIDRARASVAAGRPPCRYCGRPLDDAAWCVCHN